jgi:hypothetical protein
MKIAVITLGTKNISEYSRYSFDINKAYCEKHGYTYIQYNDVIDSSRPPSWSKILAIKDQMSHFDWIMWIDADAIFFNHDIRIEDRIDDSANLILGKASGETWSDNNLPDYVNQNMGCFIIRGKCDWSSNVCDLIYSKTDRIQHKWWETQALNDIILENDPVINSKIKILDQELINGYEYGLYGFFKFTTDQFIIHFAGISNQDRIFCLQIRHKEFQDGKFVGESKKQRVTFNV